MTNVYSYQKLLHDVKTNLSNDWEALSFKYNQIILGQWDKHALSPRRMSINIDMSVNVSSKELMTFWYLKI